VVEHPGLVEERLGYGEGSPRIAWEEYPFGQLGGGHQVQGADGVLQGHAPTIDGRTSVEDCAEGPMASRRTTPKELPDAVRDAVERTVQATVGSAGRTRDRAQGAVDDLVETVDDLVKGSRQAVRGALDERLPATQDDVRALRSELRAIGRRLDAIEERLPAPRARKASAGGSSGSRRRK
jgi:hypothetical protein